MAGIKKLTDVETSAILAQASKIETIARDAGYDAVVDKTEPIKNIGLYLPLTSMPSSGKFYGMQSVEAQPLKVPDILLLNSITSDNYMDNYTKIFETRLNNIDPLYLLSVDEDYLLIWMRENAFPGHSYTSQSFRCSDKDCGKFNGPTQFKYSQFNFTSNADEIESDKNEFVLSSGLRVRYSLRRRGHDKAVVDYIAKHYTSIGQKITKEEQTLLKIAAVTAIDGCGSMEERLRYFTSKMEPVDFVDMLGKMKTVNLRSDIFSMVPCAECNNINSVRYLFRPSIFLPSD